MRSRSPVMCRPGLTEKERTIKLSQYGVGRSGEGPTGWKLRKSKVLARSMADMVSAWKSGRGKRAAAA